MSTQPLFTPYQVGDLDLPNRIVMAPLTRMRARSDDQVPTSLQAEYYAQRATAGLIVTEGVAISPDGFGWADTPGLWTEEQVRGWRRVTNAVHAAGGRIITQLGTPARCRIPACAVARGHSRPPTSIPSRYLSLPRAALPPSRRAR
jgi:N-ethylmaleimide reductase